MEYVHAVRQLIGPDLFTSVRCLRKIMMHIRANFRIVQRILATRGFSWDPKKSCVVADDHVWDAYIKTHQIVGRWRCQPFPYYDKLCIIFGDDRSRGFQTNVLEGERGQISNETMGFKRKKYEASDLSKSCEESLEKKNNAIGDFAQTLTEKLATLSVNEATDLMDKVMTQMNDLSTLTVDKRLKTMSVIGRRAPLSFMYDRLSEDEKIRMAQLVSRGYIS
ncbi:uncharacterized protein [Rutidosis leptorrhynchoides]|uniref:uncharacterized protein n=1 Tax=Rutidosis leptorrhynchoides TaxID=125765 RepID=UPI003A98DD61